MLPNRLTAIDDTNRVDHPFLTPTDRCIFFGEYFAGKGYQGGYTNQLVFNYKIKPSVAAAQHKRAYWKNKAVSEIAAGLRGVISQHQAEQLTWVPIPTSKVVGHSEYDDRLLRTLSEAFAGYNVDIRSLLRQKESTNADHEAANNRLAPDALFDLLEVDQDQLGIRQLRESIVLFDDVLTTGKHFKCCERRIREVVGPDYPIIGVFVARRISPDPAEDFEVLS